MEELNICIYHQAESAKEDPKSRSRALFFKVFDVPLASEFARVALIVGFMLFAALVDELSELLQPYVVESDLPLLVFQDQQFLLLLDSSV
jgi:hypothetical protein